VVGSVGPSRVRFGPFELNVRVAELRQGDTRVRLPEQPFQILLMLLERRGDLVSRDEIRARLWPDATVVEFDHSINAAVKRLRNTLRDSADQPQYIETLPRRGYRFIAPVETFAPPSAEAAKDSAPPELAHAAPARSPLRGKALSVAGLLISIAAALWWYYTAQAPARWVKNVALPNAVRLIDESNAPAAFPYLHAALRVAPDDPAANRILREISHPLAIHTVPPGADIYLKPYATPEAEWTMIGRSPLENVLVPLGYFRWRIVKSGFQTVEAGGGFQGGSLEFTLDREHTVPIGMVRVGGGPFQWQNLNPVYLDDFWIDKYEVTNRQFKDFVDRGGYSNRQYWRKPFVKDGRALSWEQAMTEFRDATGRPGPSTWEVGDYRSGQDDFPVSGVSWYEAAAYAEFANKQLPTVYHWYRAASPGIYSDVLLFSNFSRTGPERVGSRPGLGAFGTYDMAGNVKEWCENARGALRYSLGGAWNEDRSYYVTPGAIEPFDRSPANGFRCMKTVDRPFSGSLAEPIEKAARDYQKETPVPDRIFSVLLSSYAYDNADLKVVSEWTDRSYPLGAAEKITFESSYARQRVPAWLYLPKGAQPPYETIVYVPPRSARYINRIDEFELKFIEFLVKSGRAVLFPICQGMYERRVPDPAGPNAERDLVVQQARDVRRGLDYLDSRSDIAHDRIGFYGVSDGARLGVILLGQEPRFKAGVLAAGGISPERKPPEIDEINFAPRIRIPVLMLNGRYDLFYLAETDQITLFRLLGTPQKDKRYVLFDIGHVPLQQHEMKETLDWFDRYLGPVSVRR
jgi:DNA-binding winged helix-turn-helix (wHTH) protein/formylglycine-generating enzyme required for sulfatase activity/cephalosporin-C deacetylase-like acetyl esterase